MLRHLPLRPLRLHRLQLFAGRAVPRVSWCARRIINSPFGLALRGIRENSVRMPAIGAPSRAHLRKVYTIAAVIAGIAGALLAQTTETVSLDVLGFQRSADVLVILILGGAGRLYGGHHRRDHLHGGARPVLRHQPAVLVFLDRPAAGRRRDVPAERHPRRAREARRRCVGEASRERRRSPRAGSTRASARSSSRKDIALELPQGARYALIGPNGAGKTTLINLMTGMLRPDAGQILLGDEDDHRAARRTSASSAGWCARSRSTRCSRT